MGKKLNAQLIQMRCKTDKLDSIDKINLWGNDLEDVSILRSMPSVKVVSLSLNKIQTLEDFAYCKNLTELYLRKNDVSDLKEIHYLAHLPKLEVLWLSDNPVSVHPSYRMFVIKILPNLTKLDEVEVTPEERDVAESMNFDDEDLSMAGSMQESRSNQPSEQYSYESPSKQPGYDQLYEPEIPSQSVQRSPVQPMPEEKKQPSNVGMPEKMQPQMPIQMPIQAPGFQGGQPPVYNMPDSWTKGQGAGGAEMYGGGPPMNYGVPTPPMKRPQTSGQYYGEAPALRYGMNETGNYLPPQQPKLMHAHSTPGVDHAAVTSGKYKNENILCAVLVLLKELKENELELVKRDIEKKLALRKMM